jgi:hypothetical protein
MRSARGSRTGSQAQGLWLTNCWEALLVAVGEARRQRLDRLAAPVEDQAAQVGLAPTVCICTPIVRELCTPVHFSRCGF